MSEWTDRFFGRLYGEIYREYLLDTERSLTEAAFASQVLDLGRRTVLDLACGFGRHARLLAASNRVFALDRNRQYLGQAREGLKPRPLQNLCLLQGDMRHIPLASKSVDAAVLLFNSFGYFGAPAALPEKAGETTSRQVWKLPKVFYERQLVDEQFGVFQTREGGGAATEGQAAAQAGMVPEEADNAEVLAELRRTLKPSGGLLIEFPNRRAVLEAVSDAPRRHMSNGEAEIAEDFEWDETTRRLNNRTRFTLGDETESAYYSLRLYDPAEAKALLADAGLKVVRTFGSYDGDRFRPAESDSLIIHARRPARG